jgi:hypothetical protein
VGRYRPYQNTVQPRASQRSTVSSQFTIRQGTGRNSQSTSPTLSFQVVRSQTGQDRSDAPSNGSDSDAAAGILAMSSMNLPVLSFIFTANHPAFFSKKASWCEKVQTLSEYQSAQSISAKHRVISVFDASRQRKRQPVPESYTVFSSRWKPERAGPN